MSVGALRARLAAPAPWLVLGIVGLVALGLRLAFLFRAPVFIIGDSENYFWPGYQLAREIGFDLDLRRTPVYPLFIAFVVARIGEDLAALALAQHLLGVATCLLVAALGIRFWGGWTGLLAGLLVAVSGPLLIAEQYVMAETLFISLATATIVWLAVALERRHPVWLFIGGLLVGVAALTRPVGLVLALAAIMAVPVAAWWRERSPTARPGDNGGALTPYPLRGATIGCADVPPPCAGEGEIEGRSVSTEPGERFEDRSLGRVVRAVLPRVLALIAGVSLIWLPWMSRNWLVHGSFSAEGNAGQALVGRAMRHDRGFAFENPSDPDPIRQHARAIMREGRGRFVTPTRDKIRRELGLSEAETNRLMRDLAWEAIVRQPGHYLIGTAQNFALLAQGTPERYRDHWATRRDFGSREEWEANMDIRHLLGPPTPLQQRQYDEAEALMSLFQSARLGPTIPLLALLGALGLALGVGGRPGRPGPAAFLALVVVGLLLAAVAMVAPHARYRYPVEPLLGLLAAGGVCTVFGLLRRPFRPSARTPDARGSALNTGAPARAIGSG